MGNPAPQPSADPALPPELHLAGRANGLLTGALVRAEWSPNHGGRFSPGRPDMIVLHYTAGGTLQGAVDTLCNPSNEASAHVVIDRDGAIVQLVPFDCKAWHAGVSVWHGITGVNARSIGIELVNWGWAHQDANTGAVHLTHRLEQQPRWWQPYTIEQMRSLTALCRLLKATFPIHWCLGHDDVASPRRRKLDPGPAFPMRSLRDVLQLEDAT